ncbi:xanthine dehydrogenase family protein molybdopterin-binding subunit [Cyclobacterium marinum]|uniref:xanthine dehydrogenase family protein molybdopterin-binding subunit n=1 Tax=Cyclobacterium marinum TaxID=104 RepID=UPI0011EC5360|nr:molybdopterin cofactor-binding domain-containing protein [Cyclobacterium marinum]MBI0397844.1 xanthine dehydrogenase family protein molybdopterin-binding subunit [Cyclobacterium marinum]
MDKALKSNRRDFLKIAATAGGGLLIGFNWSACDSPKMKVVSNEEIFDKAINYNSFLSISPTNHVVIYSPNPELGQNIKTSFPMIVAEELDVDWSNVRVKQAILDTEKYDRQVTGGSGAMPHSWQRLRQAGATARQMLMEAAAKRFEVPLSSLTTDNGNVVHGSKKLSYGELATEAASLPVPENVALKDINDFKIIGTAVKNVDNDAMFTGQPLYGLDVYRENMLHAMIQRPPFGMKLKQVDAEAAKKVKGVKDVLTFKDNVAVIGEGTWPLMKARKLLKIAYEPIGGTLESTAFHDKKFDELLNSGAGEVKRKDGDVKTAFKSASRIIKSEYQCPFLSHSPMEPMNFFANVKEDSVELIGPSQTPDRARNAAAKICGIDPEKVSVALTRLGGGFGRRLRADFVEEAVELSKMLKAPVKLTWSREDDITGGAYRPAVKYRFEAALNDKNELIGYKLSGAGINAGNTTRENNFPAGAIENLEIRSAEYKSPITTNAWRAPITNFLAFAEQSFLDEVAEAMGKDPVELRLGLLDKAKERPVGEIHYDIDRMKGVIKTVAEKSNWGKKEGVSQGFSVYFSHRSYVAQVAEAKIKDGQAVLDKIYAVTDCGIVINPTGADQQVRGGMLDGMGHAMFANLTFTDGVADQKNFDSYRLIRMKEIPEIETHFIDNGIDPTGLGEPALPPTGGAVANAIYKVSGQRMRNQPFINQKGINNFNLGSPA